MTSCRWIWRVLAVFLVSTSAQAQETVAQWGFAAFGSGIGKSGIVSATLESGTEIYVGGSTQIFGQNDRWQAMRYSSATQRFEPVYVSDHMPQKIVRITPARLKGWPPLIVVALVDGTLRLYHRGSKQLLQTHKDPCSTRGELVAFAVADLDGDRWHEVVSLCSDETLTAYGPKYATWTLPNVGGREIAIGQMDDDPALEIATTSGKVIDSVTRTVQWDRSEGFGIQLQAADVDGDGLDELIVNDWGVVWAYDVKRQLPKWSVSADREFSSMLATDIDGDGVLELLTGDGTIGFIRAYDVMTQQEKWRMMNSGGAVNSIAVADVDGDGKNDLLWSEGADSTGPDHLYLADWQAAIIVWRSVHLDGPFLGPQIGDLDGDGVAEVVVVSLTSDSGYASGRIVVFDSQTGKVRAISPGVAGGTYAWTGVHDLKLRDLDGDGRLEIVLATDWLYNGLIEAYRFSQPDTFTLIWTNASRPFGAPFHSVEVADVDGDGKLEVIGGGGRAHTGASGVFIYAYDLATGQEKWRTLQVGTYWSRITGLSITDADNDGSLEVLGTAAEGNVYVFSGADHSLKAIIETRATSLTTHNPGSGVQLLIGESSGRMSVRQFDGAGYAEVSSAVLGSAPLDGLHIAPDGALWVGTGGRLWRYVNGERTFESASYGAGLGRSILFFPESNWVFSAGSYGVHGFVTAP